MIAGEDWDANTNRRSRPPGRKCVASLTGGGRGAEEDQRRSGQARAMLKITLAPIL